jgi:CRISPR-associated protein Cmr3
MRYLITLKPLEPFMFGGDQTFGALGDKEAGSYLVKSRMFPQQTAVLGMLRKELMVQAGLLTRKLRGEWVDPQKKANAAELVGTEKFDMLFPSFANTIFANQNLLKVSDKLSALIVTFFLLQF